jgi:hypothetical protein
MADAIHDPDAANSAVSSAYLVHLTMGRAESSPYANLFSIVKDAELKPGPNAYGAARDLPEGHPCQRSACLSELPLHQLARLVRNRSPYGLGFRTSVVLDGGGARVWYVDRAAQLGQQIFRQVQDPARRADESDFLWHLTPFIDFPGEYESGSFRFEWEREWRVPGGLAFGLRDVAFLLLPEGDHQKAGKTQHIKELRCPLIDPTWSLERIHEALPAPQLDLMSVRQDDPAPSKGSEADEIATRSRASSWCVVCGPGSRLQEVDGMWRCNRCSRSARPVNPAAAVYRPRQLDDFDRGTGKSRAPRPRSEKSGGTFHSLPDLLDHHDRDKDRKQKPPKTKAKGRRSKVSTPRADGVSKKKDKKVQRSSTIDWNAPHIKIWRRGE